MRATTERQTAITPVSRNRLKAQARRLVGAHESGVAAPGATQVQVEKSGIVGLQERRRRRRAHTAPMYTSAVVRVLTRRDAPLEGHVLDLSETGVAVELDALIPVGQAVTVEFRVSGLGRLKEAQWPEFAAAAEVVRHDNLDDFPQGPYKIALRFLQISTMAQAQIARFVATHPD